MGWICALIDFVLAALVAALALPLAFRKVRMNLWYGVRIQRAFLSDEAWFDINEFGGKQMLLWSSSPAIVGLLCLCFPFDIAGEPAAALMPPILSFASLICATLIPVVRTVQYAARRYPGASSGTISAMFEMGYNPQADQQGLTKYSVLTVVLVLLVHAIMISAVIAVVLLTR